MLGTTPEDLAQFLHQEERLDSVTTIYLFKLIQVPHKSLITISHNNLLNIKNALLIKTFHTKHRRNSQENIEIHKQIFRLDDK